jgi:hypothetical protein
MRTTLLAALATTLLVATAARAQKCPKVVPGVSIGPIKVGDATARVAKLKLQKDLYEIFYDQKRSKVTSVGLNLHNARCFEIDKKTIKIDPKKLLPEAVALRIGGCGPSQMVIGGNNLYCRGGKLGLVWNRGYVSLRAIGAPDKHQRETSAPACAGYVLHGALVTGQGESKRLEPKAGKLYCFGSRVVTTKWTPKNIWDIPARSCGEKKMRGFTVLSCDWWGLRFWFKGTLRRIEAYRAKQ